MLRTFAVVTLAVLVLVAASLNLRQLSSPSGVFGYNTNGDGVVGYVTEHSPAAAAGIQTGDVIDLKSTPPQFRYSVGLGAVRDPGQSVTFGVQHKGRFRQVTVSAAPFQPRDRPYKPYILITFASTVLFVLLGSALVLLRPSFTTWSFFMYCLGATPFGFVGASLLFPFQWGLLGNIIFFNIIPNAGILGLLLFALGFLNEPLSGWRKSALPITTWLFFGSVVLTAWAEYQSFWMGGPPGELLNRAGFVVSALLSLLTMAIFLATYAHAKGLAKQRIVWILAGFGLYVIAQFLQWLIANEGIHTPRGMSLVLQLCSLAVPLTVAYAVIKHRVIDVSFVVTRALVYTMLTTLLVGTLSIVDWLFIEKLRLVRLGTIAEVGAAVAAGFWFNGLHKRIDWVVDSTFFRQRHKAEVQLAQVAVSLPHLSSTKSVAEALISEPIHALSLASAALFRRQDGEFKREDSVGWLEADLARLDDTDDRLLALVLTKQGPLSLYDHPWRSEGVPTGPGRPVLALPIIVRRELEVIIFYGSHVHGEALDPDEIKAIAGLAMGAAAAYDHLEAEAMRRQVASLQKTVEIQQALLAEAQIQPT